MEQPLSRRCDDDTHDDDHSCIRKRKLDSSPSPDPTDHNREVESEKKEKKRRRKTATTTSKHGRRRQRRRHDDEEHHRRRRRRHRKKKYRYDDSSSSDSSSSSSQTSSSTDSRRRRRRRRRRRQRNEETMTKPGRRRDDDLAVVSENTAVDRVKVDYADVKVEGASLGKFRESSDRHPTKVLVAAVTNPPHATMLVQQRTGNNSNQTNHHHNQTTNLDPVQDNNATATATTAPCRRIMAPMSREQYEAMQSQVREVYDEETGRYRWIRGDGEIIERIVSKSDHQRINQQATRGDGSSFVKQIHDRVAR